METAIKLDLKLASQWLRLAFHDAGTFNKATNEGGANGCLINHVPMRDEDENLFLDLPINTLVVIRKNWEQNTMTCIKVSGADMIQFAGFFSSLRQTGATPGLTASKRAQLKTFEWGRPDQSNCQTRWARNLPGFQLGNDQSGVAFRCLMAGKEIKDKMMDRNGFTAEEATALIGAHTIGLTRNTFGNFLAGPWVTNGADDATPNGPVFDNAYFDFLDKTIPMSTAATFQNDIRPFTQPFPDWFRDGPRDINHLDTDLALAFPTQNGATHPDYHVFTKKFSSDNEIFLTTFFTSLGKMGKLGVRVGLSAPGACDTCLSIRRRTLLRGRKLDEDESFDDGDDESSDSEDEMEEIADVEEEDDMEEIADDDEEDDMEESADEMEEVQDDASKFLAELAAATEKANKLNEAKQIRRESEIAKLVQPLEELKVVAADPETQIVDTAAFEEERKISAVQADDFLIEKAIEHKSVLGNGVATQDVPGTKKAGDDSVIEDDDGDDWWDDDGGDGEDEE